MVHGFMIEVDEGIEESGGPAHIHRHAGPDPGPSRTRAISTEMLPPLPVESARRHIRDGTLRIRRHRLKSRTR